MSKAGCQSSWSGPALGGLADERVQPSELAKSLWEPPSEKLPFLFTSIWCAGDGWMVAKVVGDAKAGPSLSLGVLLLGSVVQPLHSVWTLEDMW